jgi:hypothetical protein
LVRPEVTLLFPAGLFIIPRTVSSWFIYKTEFVKYLLCICSNLGSISRQNRQRSLPLVSLHSSGGKKW